DLGHEPHVADDGEPAVLRDRDARRLLPAVLQREEAEVGDAGHAATLGADAEAPDHLGLAPPGFAQLRDLHSEEGSAARAADLAERDADLVRQVLELLALLANAREDGAPAPPPPGARAPRPARERTRGRRARPPRRRARAAHRRARARHRSRRRGLL